MAPTLFSRVNTRSSSLNHQGRPPTRPYGQIFGRPTPVNGNLPVPQEKPELEATKSARPPVGDFLEYYKPKRVDPLSLPDDIDSVSLGSGTFNVDGEIDRSGQGQGNRDAFVSPRTRAERESPRVQRLRADIGDLDLSSPRDGPNKEQHRGPGSVRSLNPENSSNRFQDTSDSSTHTLSPLQAKTTPIEVNRLIPMVDDNPRSFDLVDPSYNDGSSNRFSLERRSEQLFSREHLHAIFSQPSSMAKFTSFLSARRPQSVPTLTAYLDTLKALRAIKYANAVVDSLKPTASFVAQWPQSTTNTSLEETVNQIFDILVHEDLPAYVTHVFVQVASMSIQKRVTGTLEPHLREASEGLAEVFCLTDPSRFDNPIIFASEEFHRTTQYGVNYAIGRNCRFLQGPLTSPYSRRRFREAIDRGKEHCEVFLNYRRDGSSFMNLLMIAPLADSRGVIRYFIGAQIDVSGLAKDCVDLEALQRMLEGRDASTQAAEEKKDEFQSLCEMFNPAELGAVQRHGGAMHKEKIHNPDNAAWHRPRLLLKEHGQDLVPHFAAKANGKLEGIYQNYLLVRPHPSLRVLFTSPSLRVPGILQSSFLDRIGGGSHVRDELSAALAEGRCVTAKVRWMARGDADSGGIPRWIHCTPLLGPTGQIGVWMVVLVDDEHAPLRTFKQAPPVPSNSAIHAELRKFTSADHPRSGTPAPPAQLQPGYTNGDESRPGTSHFALPSLELDLS